MNIKDKIQRHAFTMRVDDEFVEAVDALRRLMDPIPSKSDAVRAAVLEALAARRLQKKAKT